MFLFRNGRTAFFLTGADQAKVDLFLKTSTGNESITTIADTVGNFDTIGVILYLTQYIDSTEIRVSKNDSMEYLFVTRAKKTQIDTIYYPVHFSTPGERIRVRAQRLFQCLR